MVSRAMRFRLPLTLLAALLAYAVAGHAKPAPSPSPAPAKDGKTFEPLAETAPAGRSVFEVVPGKNSPWSFVVEPYLWAMGISGDIGIGGLPALNVDFDPKTVLQNLKWGVMGRGEVRYGKWGLLGDGFFADLEVDGNPPGPIYDGASLTMQQGMAQLALAYRVFECRAGYLDLYAGARLNYFSIATTASPDNGGIQDVATNMTDRISSRLDTLAKDIVQERVNSARTSLDADVQQILTGAQTRVQDLQREILTAIRQGKTADIARLETLQQTIATELGTRVGDAAQTVNGIQNAVRTTVQDDLTKRLVRRWALVPDKVREFTRQQDISRMLNPARRDFRNLVESSVRLQAATLQNAVLQRTANQLVTVAENRVAAAQKVLETSLAAKSPANRQAARRLLARAEGNLAQAQAFRAQTATGANTAKLEADVAQARKKFAKKLADEIEDALPTGSGGDRWWVDPIVGFRAQVNITRWLFLATQCDVGGFGAASKIAWNLNGSVGVNFTRNLFAEVGYRYYYMDYVNSGLTYQAAEQGMFFGGGVRF